MLSGAVMYGSRPRKAQEPSVQAALCVHCCVRASSIQHAQKQ